MEKVKEYLVVFLIFFGGGFGIWVYQLYHWLNYAEWTSFSLLRVLSHYSRYQDWVYYPHEWLGVHEILDFIPLSIFLIMIGLILINLEKLVDYIY